MPSSPNGPCRIGSTTSIAPSAAGAAAVGIGRPARRFAERRGAGAGGSAQAPSRPISIVCVS